MAEDNGRQGNSKVPNKKQKRKTGNQKVTEEACTELERDAKKRRVGGLSPELPSEMQEIQIYRGGQKTEPSLSAKTAPISEYFGVKQGKRAKNLEGQSKGKAGVESGDNLWGEGEVREGNLGSEVRSDPGREIINRSQRNLKPLDVTAPELQAKVCEVLNPEEGLGNLVPG